MKKLAFIFLCVSVCLGQSKLAHMLSGVKYVTSGTYTFATADGTQVVSFDGTTAATLPRGTVAGFGSGHVFAAYNKGGSPVVITCDNCTINGAGSFTLATDASVEFRSDGLNYVAMAGGAGGPGNGGGILGVTASPPMQSSGGTLPNVSLPAASANDSGYLGASDFVSFSNRLSSLTATPPLSATAGLNPTISLQAATTANPGYLTAGDWNTFNNKVGAVTAGAPLLSSGGSSPNLTIQQADSTHSGFLSFTDWNTFNSAVGAAGDLKSAPTASQSVRQPPTTSFDPNVLQKTRYVDSSWTWTQSPTGTLTGGVQATVTLAPCPRGIDASGDYRLGVQSLFGVSTTPGGYKVHIGAVGTAEDVFVTGGTCTPSAASGTIIFTPYFGHSAGFSVSSSSQGIQEAINDACGPNGVISPAPYNNNGRCRIVLQPGMTYTITGTVFYHAMETQLDFNGGIANCLTRGPCFELGREMDASYNKIVINDLAVYVGTDLAATDATYSGCMIASTQRISGLITITTTGTCPFRTGDPVTILWTDNNAYWGDVPYITVTGANTFTYPRAGVADIPLQSTPGTVALTFVAVRDNAMHTTFNRPHMYTVGNVGAFVNFFDFWDDEDAVINGFDNAAIQMVHTANWTSTYIFSGGATQLQNRLQQLAPVITLNDSSITANYSSCATILNSNGFYVNNTVCQAAGPWAWKVDNSEGNYQGASFRNIYSESSANANSLSPVRSPWPGTGIAGLVAGIVSSGASFSIMGSGGLGGAIASYGSGGTSYSYYLVTHDTTLDAVTQPIRIMDYLSTGSDSPVVRWPRQSYQTDVITYDILRTLTPSGSPGTVNPYPGGCGGGSTSACGSVATGLAQCSGFVCTFTDTAANATTAYTVPSGTGATFAGNFIFLPAGGAGITAGKAVVSDREQMMIGLSNVGPTDYALNCDGRGLASASGFTVCLGGGTVANTVKNQTATILTDGPVVGGGMTNTKGRLNFNNLNGVIEPHHIITLIDSQPGQTRATNGYRPLASANDVWIGTDVAAAGVGITAGQLSFGAPVAISNYIANTGNDTSWLERLTASKKEFKIATQFDSTVSIVGEADGCAYFDGTQIKSMAAPCVGYPGSTGTQVPVVVDGAAWGTSLDIEGTDAKLLSSAGSLGAAGSSLCVSANGGATTSGCTGGTGTLSASDTPATGHIGVWTSATELSGASTPIAADLITYATPQTGIARTTVAAQNLIASEISGDCTTSGSNAITCTKTGGVAFGTGATATIADYVPKTTTVNSKALSGNISITTTDLALNNLTNDAQTKAAIVPNTAPASGQVLVGNGGGTAYAPVAISQDETLAASGAVTVTGLRAKSLPSLPGTFQYLDYTGSAWGFTDLTGTGTSCVQVSAGGQMSRSGAACGSGGSGNGTVSNSDQANRFAVYAAPGTTVSPTSSAATIDASGNAVFNSISIGSTPSNVCGTATQCIALGAGDIGSAGNTPGEGALLLDSGTGLWNVALPSVGPIPSLMNYEASAVPALTMTGEITTLASASGGAGLNLPHGAAPSSPANGDVWTTTGGFYARINGSTVGPFSTGGSMTWPSTPGIAVCTGTPCTAWTTSLTAPSGTVVGTSDSQALTSKTYNGLNISSPGSKTLTVSDTMTLSGTTGLNTDNAVTAATPATAINYIPLSAGASKAVSWTQFLPAAQLGAHASGDVQNNNGGDLNISTIKGAAIPTSASLLGTNSSQQPVGISLAPSTLTDAATVTWGIGSAVLANAKLTFTVHSGSRTLNITNPVSGGNYVLVIVQDATGGEGLSLGTGCTWKVSGGGSGTVTLSTGANAIDILAFYYDGTNCYANLNKNFN